MSTLKQNPLFYKEISDSESYTPVQRPSESNLKAATPRVSFGNSWVSRSGEFRA